MIAQGYRILVIHNIYVVDLLYSYCLRRIGRIPPIETHLQKKPNTDSYTVHNNRGYTFVCTFFKQTKYQQTKKYQNKWAWQPRIQTIIMYRWWFLVTGPTCSVNWQGICSSTNLSRIPCACSVTSAAAQFFTISILSVVITTETLTAVLKTMKSVSLKIDR